MEKSIKWEEDSEIQRNNTESLIEEVIWKRLKRSGQKGGKNTRRILVREKDNECFKKGKQVTFA